MNNPFVTAKGSANRAKLLIQGGPNAGKTVFALQFPDVAMIDLDGGSAAYADNPDFGYKFDRLPLTTPDDVLPAVDYLLTQKHDYKTLVIDPISIWWDALQEKWQDIYLRRLKGRTGHKEEFYEMGPKDWQPIKRNNKELMRKLVLLDMNVIVTARLKNEYAPGAELRKIGTTFDGEKNLPYEFDYHFEIYKGEGEGRILEIKKWRGKQISGTLPASYETIAKYFTKEVLERPAAPVELITQEQLSALVDLMSESGLSNEKVQRRLVQYGVDTFEGLTSAQAQELIGKVKEYTQQKAKAGGKKEKTTEPIPYQTYEDVPDSGVS